MNINLTVCFSEGHSPHANLACPRCPVTAVSCGSVLQEFGILRTRAWNLRRCHPPLRGSVLCLLSSNVAAYWRKDKQHQSTRTISAAAMSRHHCYTARRTWWHPTTNPHAKIWIKESGGTRQCATPQLRVWIVEFWANNGITSMFWHVNLQNKTAKILHNKDL